MSEARDGTGTAFLVKVQFKPSQHTENSASAAITSPINSRPWDEEARRREIRTRKRIADLQIAIGGARIWRGGVDFLSTPKGRYDGVVCRSLAFQI